MVFLLYTCASLLAGHGQVILPLDDVYIHFQYARQLANGQPYVYNPGLPPTSGATSFLYPYVLGLGYLLGFQGLNLGLWALAIGALALAVSAWLVALLALAIGAPYWVAVLTAVLFAASGPVSWHFMSGMETGPAICFTLFTLYAMLNWRFGWSIAAMTLLALIRPEGSILALFALAVLLVQHRMQVSTRKLLLYSLIPLLAVAAQPLVNLALTGSAVASGNTAKSVFGMVPPYPDLILARILENFVRMWAEFVYGSSPREGMYLPPLMAVLAFPGLLLLYSKTSSRPIALLLILWFLVGTLALATLDTVFWHFKRYQMPLIALFFPLAIWGLEFIVAKFSRHVYLLAVLALIPLLLSTGQFFRHYLLNVHYVYAQPYQMARWLLDNTSSDAVVALHDVGLMRYLSNRTTIDIVGLTTPGAAEAWRNGPGAVAQFLENARPDYIASYGPGHGVGLSYFVGTSLYADELAGFSVTLDNRANVALAADHQGIYRPDWQASQRSTQVLQPSTLIYLENFEPVDTLDVADLTSEAAHSYRWSDDERLPGFPTEVFEFNDPQCALHNCTVLDGGRRINGSELFTLSAVPQQDVILVSRLHPANAGTFDVYANDVLVDTQWIPWLPGQWLEVATLIPAQYVTEQTAIRVIPHTPGGHYMPYHHWAYQGNFSPQQPVASLATFQGGAIILADYRLDYESDLQQLRVTLDWHSDGSAQGDYKLFVHLLNTVGEIAAQTDVRPGQGTLPPGNWLPGILHDAIVVDLNHVERGVYQVVIGLYDPITLDRLVPQVAPAQDRVTVSEDGRLFIGEVEFVPNG